MITKKIRINNIPAIIWGEQSDNVYLFVHGKMSSKEAAEEFAQIAEQKGYQTISFDLAQHGKSPILDMEYLIKQMMIWFDVSEERLEREKEVDTTIDILSWAYYQYVLAHPVKKWNIPTAILYGGKDNLQSLEVVKKFVEKFRCKLAVAENSEHSFMGDGDIVEEWLLENI